jgi:hypothetical protein
MTSDTEAARLIDFTPAKARKAMLKSESYSSFDLPLYFDFTAMLGTLSQQLVGQDVRGLCNDKPGECEDVNHVIFHSKDGMYAWRPQEMIHPVLFVDLVHQLTSDEGWALVKSKFQTFAEDARIECVSHPVISLTEKRKDKATTILSWWQAVEQRSLSLSLDYKYVIHTDVADCYGSISTHSIAWALHGREFSKSKAGRNDRSLLGNRIDEVIRWSRQNESNGIPQGSVVMNLLAELVLGYADRELSEAIKAKGIYDFFILRYRDDCRIFANDPSDAEAITKLMAEVLRKLGMKLNPSKTLVSNDLIKSSIKEDKMYWMGKEKRKRSLLKHLLLIHEHATEFPNSGSMATAISKFQKRLSKVEKTGEPFLPMVAILTDIAVKNPRIYPHFSAILSKLLDLMLAEDREGAIDKVLTKFSSVPYSGHVHIWMQRFAVPMGLALDYEEPLTESLDQPDHQLWNSSWLPEAWHPLLAASTYVNRETVAGLSTVISDEEVELFGSGYY